jgi:hypothetical protein
MTKDSLEERVRQFQMMKLPGQPMGMHMGTAYLINDLWREVQRLRKLRADADQSPEHMPEGER